MSDERDLIDRLAEQLTDAAERQAAAPHGWRAWGPRRGWRAWRGWVARRSTRTLGLIGAGVVLAGAGGAASLLAPRGEVGGPPTLTFARLAPEQRAAGLRELTRPIVIGRGRLPESGRAWQLVAFQTTRGLCIAVDFPGERGLGGGCGSDRPQDGRVVDWQGHLARLGDVDDSVLVGAVRPGVPTVRVAHGYARKGRREVVRARIVRVADPLVLAHLRIQQPFAYWVAELTGDVNHGKVVAYDAAGERLGAMGVPWISGNTGFAVPGRGCEAPPFASLRAVDEPIALPAALRDAVGALARPQGPADRPPALVRRLTGPGSGAFVGAIDVASMRRVGTGIGGRPLYLVAYRQRNHQGAPGCLRSRTPREQAREARLRRLAAENARVVRVMLVDEDGTSLAGGSAEEVWSGRNGSSRGDPRVRPGTRRTGPRSALVTGLVPDGVATVELRYRDGLRRTVPVAGNHFQAVVPLGAGAALDARQIWRDRDGRVVPRRGR